MRKQLLLICSTYLFSSLSFGQFGFERIDTIAVYENAVQQAIPWAGGMDYCQFSNIDLNFDGVEDLFVFDRTCDKVLTFIHNGTPNMVDYTYAPEYEDDFPENLQEWVMLADYNCDGKKDLFGYTIGGLMIFTNTGSAGTGLQWELAKNQVKTWRNGVETFMYINSIDIPAILDVDGDNDIDILTFGTSGTSVSYYKNMSMETYGVCDSILFHTKNECWGRFKEATTDNTITLYDTLTWPCDGSITNPESVINYEERGDGPLRHSGSTIMALDMDNNNVKELVIGDISYNNLVLLWNEGNVVNTNSSMNAVDYNFPSNSVPVDVTIMPAGYHVDVNNDGIRDVLASPSSTIEANNWCQGVWFYENTGTEALPVFEFVEKGLFQDDMIDAGTSSMPVFFDHNGDGLLDLMVGVHQWHDTIAGIKSSRILYYENTGTLGVPEFTLMDDDYMNISTLGIGSNLSFYPTFGDMDNDGDEDMIISEYGGYLYYFENTGGAGNPAIFNTYITLEDDQTDQIFHGNQVYPLLIDLDRDDDNDLVIGRRNGLLTYYENIGGPTTYSLQWVTDSLGYVDVSEYWSFEGHSIPQFIDVEGDYRLVLGSKTGYLHYYEDIDSNLSGSWTLIDSTLEDINIGLRSAPAIADITGDNRLEMVLGNQRGGLALYKSGIISDIGIIETKPLDFNMYPNPANQQVKIELGDLNQDVDQMIITIYDLSGRVVYQVQPKAPELTINLANFSKGTYLVEIKNQKSVGTQKLIVN